MLVLLLCASSDEILYHLLIIYRIEASYTNYNSILPSNPIQNYL